MGVSGQTAEKKTSWRLPKVMMMMLMAMHVCYPMENDCIFFKYWIILEQKYVLRYMFWIASYENVMEMTAAYFHLPKTENLYT